MFLFGAPVLLDLSCGWLYFHQTPISDHCFTLVIFCGDLGGGLTRLFHCHPFDPVMILNWCFPWNFEPGTSINQSSEIIFSSRQRSGMEMNQTWRWKSEFGFKFVCVNSNTNSFEAMAAVWFKSIFLCFKKSHGDGLVMKILSSSTHEILMMKIERKCCKT